MAALLLLPVLDDIVWYLFHELPKLSPDRTPQPTLVLQVIRREGRFEIAARARIQHEPP